MTDLAESASLEWSRLVTAAVLGTDRRPLPASGAGWESVAPTADAAVELLNRAAAVATARRAGVRPDPPPPLMPPAPVDARPACPAAAADALARMLDGDYAVLLPEWFARCEAAGFQPPRHLVPQLLLRGRRSPAFDVAARRLIGPLAEWLAEAMPELGLAGPGGPGSSAGSAGSTRRAPVPGDEFVVPPRHADSGAVVSTIVQTFFDRSATWAAAAQLRLAVVALDEAWLPALVLELNRAPFHTVTERTRVDLLGLAQARMVLANSLPPVVEGRPVT